jgi:hypothetical protein
MWDIVTTLRPDLLEEAAVFQANQPGSILSQIAFLFHRLYRFGLRLCYGYRYTTYQSGRQLTSICWGIKPPSEFKYINPVAKFKLPRNYFDPQCARMGHMFQFGFRVGPVTQEEIIYDPLLLRPCQHATGGAIVARCVNDVYSNPKYTSHQDVDVIKSYHQFVKQADKVWCIKEKKECMMNDEYIAKLVGEKKREGIENWKRIQDLPLSTFISTNAHSLCFLKWETLAINKYKDIRVIKAPTKIMKQMYGPYCYSFSKQLGRVFASKSIDDYRGIMDYTYKCEVWLYASGYNRKEIGIHWYDCFRYLKSIDAEILGLQRDMGRFDMHTNDPQRS